MTYLGKQFYHEANVSCEYLCVVCGRVFAYLQVWYTWFHEKKILKKDYCRKCSFLIFVEGYLTYSCNENCIGLGTKIVGHQQKITEVYSILSSIKIGIPLKKSLSCLVWQWNICIQRLWSDSLWESDNALTHIKSFSWARKKIRIET